MNWDLNAECYKRVYNYLGRRCADVDSRFFGTSIHRFELVYANLNRHSHLTDFLSTKSYCEYLSPQLITECRALIKLIPTSKQDEFDRKLKRDLERSITGKTCLKNAFEYLKRWVIRAKTQVVYSDLDLYCQKVNEDGIDWNLQPIMKRNKPVYVISRDSLEYFSSRIIQQRIKSDYNLRLLSRNSIIDGIKENLTDCLPKSIIRTDIVEFYERIDRSKLVDILSFDGLLPIDQLIAIKRLFYNFQLLTSKEIGLPRGNGISAYLSEVLLKTFDIFAKNLNEVIYYARFVDDIIVIVKEEERNTTKNADKVWEKLNIKIAELSLLLHPLGLKTTIGYTNSGCSFDYLGYKFSVNNNQVDIGISGSKISRYKKKISLAFWDFYKDRDSSIGVKTTLLRNRLRYLTLVTMLSGMKSGIKVGLPATYLNLTDFSGLDELDKFLNTQKMKLPVSCLARLKDCNFRNGYESMKSTHFRVNDLKQILCIWSGV